MALTLTLQEGDGFWIGDRRWYVSGYDDGGVELVGPEGQRVMVTEKEAIEIEPEVFAQEGFIPEMGCRIALEAPRKIAILRDDLYQRGETGARSGSHVPGKRP